MIDLQHPCGPPVSRHGPDVVALVPITGAAQEAKSSSDSGWAKMPDLSSVSDSDDDLKEQPRPHANVSMLAMFGDGEGKSSIKLLSCKTKEKPGHFNFDWESVLDDPELGKALSSAPLEPSFQGVSRVAKGRPLSKRNKTIKATENK